MSVQCSVFRKEGAMKCVTEKRTYLDVEDLDV